MTTPDVIAMRIDTLPPTHQRLLRIAIVPGQGSRRLQAHSFHVNERTIGRWRKDIMCQIRVKKWEQAVAAAYLCGSLQSEVL